MSIGPELLPVPAPAARPAAARVGRQAEPAPEFGAVLGAALNAARPPAPRPEPPAHEPIGDATFGSDLDEPAAVRAGGATSDVRGADAPGGRAGSSEHGAGASGVDGEVLAEVEDAWVTGGPYAADAEGAAAELPVDDAAVGDGLDDAAGGAVVRGGREAVPGAGAGAHDAPAHVDGAEAGLAAPEVSTAEHRAAVERVDTDLGRLDAEFRSRLERVIQRMRDEYGHDVRVVEGYRAPERQAHLHAQGRTRPGPVVTWTLNSAHTRGQAADVIVDGTYDNPAGYARLARVAVEEGLRTLGARDPGHLELATGESVSGGTGRAGGAGGPLVARPAAVAVAAEVRAAAPAAVAQVARPAAPEAGLAGVAGATGRGRAAASRGGVTERELGMVSGSVAVETSPGQVGAEGGAGTVAESAASVAPTPTNVGSTRAGVGLGAVPGADVVGRVLEVAELKELAAARPASHMLLHLDDVGGGARIRVGVRGAVVDAMLNVADPATADTLAARLSELRGALERKGLEPGTLRVRPSMDGGDILEAARAMTPAAAAEGVRAGAPARETGSGWSQEYARDGSTHREKRDAEPDHQRSRKGANPEEGA